MKIQFDQGTRAPLRRALHGHLVATAFEKGWSDLNNVDLLRKAEQEFDVLITTDQNLRYQQNLAGRRIAILALPTTSWPKIQPNEEKVTASVNRIKPGDYVALTF